LPGEIVRGAERANMIFSEQSAHLMRAVRVTSAAVKIVPVAGDVVAYPLDKTADAID
jgi:hypothetical protein